MFNFDTRHCVDVNFTTHKTTASNSLPNNDSFQSSPA